MRSRRRESVEESLSNHRNDDLDCAGVSDLRVQPLVGVFDGADDENVLARGPARSTVSCDCAHAAVAPLSAERPPTASIHQRRRGSGDATSERSHHAAPAHTPRGQTRSVRDATGRRGVDSVAARRDVARPLPARRTRRFTYRLSGSQPRGLARVPKRRFCRALHQGSSPLQDRPISARELDVTRRSRLRRQVPHRSHACGDR
jgi:hypothetical protein